MEKQEAHNWSRHYDTMQWTLTGFFVAGMVTLFAQDPEKIQIDPSLIGALLSPIVAFYTSSFRAFRRRVHGYLSEIEENELRSPSPLYRQKYVTALMIVGVNIYCYCKLLQLATTCKFEALLIVLAALSSIAILALHHFSDSVYKRERVDQGDADNPCKPPRNSKNKQDD
jgi:hypothetical protein